MTSHDDNPATRRTGRLHRRLARMLFQRPSPPTVRLADGRLRKSDGTIIPKPTSRFTRLDLNSIVEVPDSPGDETVDEYGEYRSMGAVVRDAKAASRLPLRGEYPVTTETVAAPTDRGEPSQGDLERLSDVIDAAEWSGPCTESPPVTPRGPSRGWWRRFTGRFRGKAK